jgi:hypothetical protein
MLRARLVARSNIRRAAEILRAAGAAMEFALGFLLGVRMA